jgi:hypothetical protein
VKDDDVDDVRAGFDSCILLLYDSDGVLFVDCWSTMVCCAF